MDNEYFWLVIGELIVILFIITIRIIFYILEKRKINSILDFMQKYKKDKEAKKHINECLNIIKQNNKEE